MFLRFGCYPPTKSQSVYVGIGKSLQEEEDDSVILMMMINGFIKCSAVIVGASPHAPPLSPSTHWAFSNTDTVSYFRAH